MGRVFDNKLTVNLKDANIQAELCGHVIKLLQQEEGYKIRPLVMLCIGSDRYTGDALGPLVGSYLKEQTDCHVYGHLEHPVHAGNLVATVDTIKRWYHQPLIIAVDACLGRTKEIGNIEAWSGGLDAGIAVGQRLPRVGNISIVGVVNSGQFGYLDLQSTPLSMVMKLSKTIGHILENVVSRYAPPGY